MTVGKKYICVLQRGWVIVGTVESVSTREIVLKNAASIIGQTGDIGHLALNGTVSNTQLYPCGTVRFHPLTSCFYLDCNPEAWG